VEEAEGGGVGLGGLLVVGDGAWREEPGAHGTTRLVVRGTPAAAASAATPSKTAFEVASKLRVDLVGVRSQVGEGGDAGGHGEKGFR